MIYFLEGGHLCDLKPGVFFVIFTPMTPPIAVMENLLSPWQNLEMGLISSVSVDLSALCSMT